MNWKKGAGIGLIVLGGLGTGELARRAATHYHDYHAASWAHYKANSLAGELAFHKNDISEDVTKLGHEVEFCRRIDEDNKRIDRDDRCVDGDYGCSLKVKCSALEQKYDQYAQKLEELKAEYKAVSAEAKKQKELWEYHDMWFQLDLSGILITSLAGALGVYLVCRKKKED